MWFNLQACVFISTVVWSSQLDYDIDLERIEGIPGDKETLVNYSNWRVTRSNKGYLMSGTVERKVDTDNSFSQMATTAYSPLGNNNFISYPFKVKKTPTCDYYNTTYKRYIMQSFMGHSNFPVIPEEGLCPIPKGVYYAKDVLIKTKNLPMHLPRGLWKISEIHFKGDEVIGGITLFLKVFNKIS